MQMKGVAAAYSCLPDNVSLHTMRQEDGVSAAPTARTVSRAAIVFCLTQRDCH